MKSKITYPFLEVVWDDAASNDGWVDLSEDTSPERVTSRGWLVRETESYLTLAAAVFETKPGTVGGTQTIPLGMIVSRRELRITNASSKSRTNKIPKVSGSIQIEKPNVQSE